MTAAILGIAASLIGLIVWWVKRSAAKADDPVQQNRDRYAQIDKDIEKKDSLGATAHATADLDELERLQNARNGNQR